MWYNNYREIKEQYNHMYPLHKALKYHGQQEQVAATAVKLAMEQDVNQERKELKEQVNTTNEEELHCTAVFAFVVHIKMHTPIIKATKQHHTESREESLVMYAAQGVLTVVTSMVTDEDNTIKDPLKIRSWNRD